MVGYHHHSYTQLMFVSLSFFFFFFIPHLFHKSNVGKKFVLVTCSRKETTKDVFCCVKTPRLERSGLIPSFSSWLVRRGPVLLSILDLFRLSFCVVCIDLFRDIV